MTRSHLLRDGLCLAGLLIFVGCSGGSDAPTFHPVSGVVEYKGNPVANATVVFTPETGPAAVGKTDATGRYELTTTKPKDGAVAGTHKVTIKVLPDAIPAMPGTEAPGAAAAESPIPAKYADAATSGLTAPVEETENEFDFRLED